MLADGTNSPRPLLLRYLGHASDWQVSRRRLVHAQCIFPAHKASGMEAAAGSCGLALQGPMKNQVHVAHVLGVPANKVVAKAKRLGGGFGGKETRRCAEQQMILLGSCSQDS